MNEADDSSREIEDRWGDFVLKGRACPKCRVYFDAGGDSREHTLWCAPPEGLVQALNLFDFGDVNPKVVEKWLPFFRGEAHCPACKAMTPYRLQARVEHLLEHWVSKRDARELVFRAFRSTSIPSAEGRKDDAGKLRWSLLPLRAMKSVVEVLEYGARKYSEGGWKSVSRQRYVEAAFRHMVAIADGEKLDAESGLPHAAHAVCCLLFIIHFDGEKP